MIPHQLRFHGVRDYEPTSLDLSGMNEHILIAGPNGSGKSTITFCMGAVLKSSKVAIEGLRSNNLPDGKTWRAAIHFMFKNEGETRIDAPLYIEFSLDLEQLPGQPIKQVYRISEGDEIDQLETKAVYRSGGQPNFTDYKRELLEKYKIYPDHYYLIWYQQEVNQFATMSPEERFRVFSEMHNITHIQRNWEKSLERVKENAASVQDAEISVNNDELRMQLALKNYKRLKQNRESIHKNGTKLFQSLHALIDLNRKEYDLTERTIEDLSIDLEEKKETIHQYQIDYEQLQHQKDIITAGKEKLQIEYAKNEKDLTTNKEQEQLLQDKLDKLEEEVQDVRKSQKKLRFSEAETKARFEKNEKELTKKNKYIENIEHTKQQLHEEMTLLMKEEAQLENEIKQFKKEQKKYQALLKQYNSSHDVKERIQLLEEEMSEQRELLDEIKKNLQASEAQLRALETNQPVSKRQEDVLKQMKRLGIQAYPLQSLVELHDDASIEAEKKLDAIKYTIFYDGKYVPAVNDLYHVSLRKIVPEYYLDSIPELQLQMKRGLEKYEQAFASKVLWWIKQLMSKEYPYIDHGQLFDSQGVRGTQEKETYILSKKALKIQKKNYRTQVLNLRKELQQLEEKQKHTRKELQHLHSIVNQVVEAEGFQLKIPTFNQKIQQLKVVRDRLEAIDKENKHLDLQAREVWNEIARLEFEIGQLQNELDVYEQLGQLKDKIELLSNLEKKQKEIEQTTRLLQRKVEKLEDQSNEIERQEIKMGRQIESLHADIDFKKNEQKAIERQIEDKNDEKDIYQGNIIKYEEELIDMKNLYPKLYEEVSKQERRVERSEIKLQNIYTKARNGLQIAQNEEGINPEAENIYFKMKETYEKNKKELDQLKALLEKNKARAEEIEENLMTSIRMKVIQIHQLFQGYMNEFQFECEIDFDKYEERNGRINFRLFIKVRKQGHRGKMEDVSLKARAGRVGKGVSGGEESLSSLLFALALLQELDTNPSFIVLDEFDSALDEGRKAKVFELYAEELERKLIIISPKGHDNEYLNHFRKAYITRHDPNALKTSIVGIRNRVGLS